jgi:pimeloyl-ACP methyl ester carboxylesterase
MTDINQATRPDPAVRSFVVLRDADTLATERISRSARRVDSDLVNSAQGVRITTTMVLAPDGLVKRAEIVVRLATAASDAPPLQHVTLEFEPEAVLLRTDASDAAPAQRIPLPLNALPFLNLSVATAEQIFVRARSLGGESAQVPIFSVMGGKVATATVRWGDSGSAVLSLEGVDLHAHVTSSGEIVDAAVPDQRVRFTSAESQSNNADSSFAPSSATIPLPDYSAPSDAPYSAEEVRVTNASAGVQLAGTLTMPHHAAGARVPAVVMITGSGPQDRDEATPAIPGWRPFRQIADALGRRGIAVLRMDDRGVGGSDRGPSSATSEDFADDIRAALAYLRARDDVEPSRLALIGHSEGGMIAPMVAETDRALHAIVLIAGPGRTGRAVSDQQVRASLVARGLTGAQLESEIAANDRLRDAQIAASPWLRFWFAHDPLATAKRVAQPVLIIQGATDTQVSPDQAEELAAAFRSGGNRDVTVRVLPEINHLMVHDPNGSFADYGKLASLSVSPVVLDEIGAWLEQRLR